MARPHSGSHHAPFSSASLWLRAVLAVSVGLLGMALSGLFVPHAIAPTFAHAGLRAQPFSASLVDATTPSSVRVAVFGDSLTTQSFPMLATDLGFVTNTTLDVQNDSFPGTAPCDWLTSEDGRPSMSQVAQTFQPNVVVLEFVGNDGTSCISGSANQGPEAMAWQYVDDLATAIRMFLQAGAAHVIVVGGPTIAPTANFSPAAIDGYIRFFEWALVQVADTPSVTWADAGSSVDEFMGAYTPTLPCASIEDLFGLCAGLTSAFGPEEPVRASDGIHLCDPGPFFNCTSYSSGAWRFAGAEARAIEATYGLGPAPLL